MLILAWFPDPHPIPKRLSRKDFASINTGSARQTPPASPEHTPKSQKYQT